MVRSTNRPAPLGLNLSINALNCGLTSGGFFASTPGVYKCTPVTARENRTVIPFDSCPGPFGHRTVHDVVSDPASYRGFTTAAQHPLSRASTSFPDTTSVYSPSLAPAP